MEPIIFMLCLTLHNTEEALWLTKWRERVMPQSRRAPENQHFLFAVLGITLLGYLAGGMFALFPGNPYLERIFLGFVGAMLINALVPHLLLTIRYGQYCPGILTGCLLILPFHSMILYNGAMDRVSIGEIIGSTVVVGLLLLAAIPLLERLAKRVLVF